MAVAGGKAERQIRRDAAIDAGEEAAAAAAIARRGAFAARRLERADTANPGAITLQSRAGKGEACIVELRRLLVVESERQRREGRRHLVRVVAMTGEPGGQMLEHRVEGGIGVV